MDVEPEELESDPDFFTQDGPGLFDPAPSVEGAQGLAARPTAGEEKQSDETGAGAGPSAGRDAGDNEPLALYRRYRPEVFSEVIGQEHVTEPLRRALERNRVNHAYLFSGPRGCGKTSSARILARSLNCEKGPTPDPCGVCQSCRDLGRGGGGSIDVIEIDAASHGGVDDARDLRERAFFAPVHSRYKIYIVDEAHMVTTAGFNALLKLVEEPPPHVKFIFATTEPDKVIGTIRSRTHHYPFRLIPPKTMTAYLTGICEQENVRVEPGVLPMVVRAGGGSVRDSLSVLDQLFGGAPDEGVAYAQATALLGYTPDALLDSVVDAIASDDARGVFAGIDKVIETGQDPRRFTEDLLTRLRDLVIVAAVPDALSSGLLDVSDDQGERYAIQAKRIGVGSLTRAAEVLAAGLVAMRGTTAPRLQLELMCSRILLPGADAGERGIHARLERLERRLDITDQGAGAASEPVRSPAVASAPVSAGSAAPDAGVTRAGGVSADAPQAAGSPSGGGWERSVDPSQGGGSGTSGRPGAAAKPVSSGRSSGSAQSFVDGGQMGGSGAPGQPSPGEPSSAQPTPGRPAPGQPSAPSRPATASPASVGLTTDDIRRSWPRVLQRVSGARRYVWMILNQYATVTELRGDALWLTFSDPGARDTFNHANGEDQVAQAVAAELGATLVVRARLESEPIPADGKTSILSVAPSAPAAASARPQRPPQASVGHGPAGSSGGGRQRATISQVPPPDEPDAPPSGRDRFEQFAPSSHEPNPAAAPASPHPASVTDSAVDPTPEPTEPDLPAPDDIIVENPGDEAEGLVMELFGAELVKEETTTRGSG